MSEILKFVQEASPLVIALVVVAYFLKFYLEKRLEKSLERLESIAKTSLDMKKDLRGAERGELVAFRVAVEEWEYFLQTGVFDLANAEPSNMDTSALYKNDKELFGKVRLAIVRVSIYLRNHELEGRLLGMIVDIRKHYYPLIYGLIPQIIDTQVQLAVIDTKLAKFKESGFQDISFAPTEADRAEHLQLQTVLTASMQTFSNGVVEPYKAIAEKLYELKEAVNVYIYRPISQAEIDRE